jgi:hypothetical protein
MKRITPQTPEPIPRAPSESDEDRIRKLLEALGQPPGSRPPPPVLPRTDIPPRPLAPVPPPMSPLSQLRREKSRKREIKGIPPPQPLTSAAKTVPTFEVHEGSSPIEQAPTVKTATRAIARIEEARIEIVTLLASKSGLRDHAARNPRPAPRLPDDRPNALSRRRGLGYAGPVDSCASHSEATTGRKHVCKVLPFSGASCV